MGENALFDLAVGEKYGGRSGSAKDIVIAGRSLTHGGGNIGIVLSWMIHQLIAKYFLEQFGSEEQKEIWLNGIAKGRLTPCFAVSEPEKGAHPKFLKTSAVYKEGFYYLSGEKTFLTNGPIADLFIVIAVSGELDGKKQFTAFILPKECDGLDILPPMKIPFFKPAPHGSIRLNNCKVAAASVLGVKGSAYEDIVLPFREIEDTVMAGPVTGAMARQLELVARSIQTVTIPGDKELSLMVGKLKSMLDTACVLSEKTADLLDSGKKETEIGSLNLYFRDLAKRYQATVKEIVEKWTLKPGDRFDLLTNDLVASARIAAGISEIKQVRLGNKVLAVRPGL
jgi:acyl-CoA dehydrogenase